MNCTCKTKCNCKNIYELAVLEGRAAGLTLSEYLDSVEGEDGSQGIAGASAFRLWLDDGHVGDINDFWDWLRGAAGNDGQSSFTSHVFKRVASGIAPDKPIGGNYLSPYPVGDTWSDGPVAGEGILYMSFRVFTSDGLPPQKPEWSEPVPVADSDTIDIEWSSVEFSPGTPDTIPDNWSNESDETSIWMAIRKFSNGYWESWNIIRVKGEKGETGNPGNTIEIRYQKNGSFTVPPSLVRTDRTPLNWTLEAPVLSNGEYLWRIQAIVNPNDNTLVGQWSVPIRETGEKGDEGVKGPSLMFRGDWKADRQYQGNSEYVELVRYLVNGLGYITRSDKGLIPIGTVPTNTEFFNEVPINTEAVFTDFLFAYAAYIEDLTVGSIQTGVSGERTTIGYKPVVVTDPSSDFSKHGTRTYDKNGNLSLYIGASDVDTYAVLAGYATPVGTTDTYKTFALEPQDRRIVFYTDTSSDEGFILSHDIINHRAGGKIELSNTLSGSGEALRYIGLGTNTSLVENGSIAVFRKIIKPTDGYQENGAVRVEARMEADSGDEYTGLAFEVRGKIKILSAPGSVLVGGLNGIGTTEVGYTGTINGARFINGICVGPE